MKRLILEVPIEKVITNRELRLVNIEKPLQSKKPILVDKEGECFRIVDGHHRFFKKRSLGHKHIKVEVRRG